LSSEIIFQLVLSPITARGCPKHSVAAGSFASSRNQPFALDDCQGRGCAVEESVVEELCFGPSSPSYGTSSRAVAAPGIARAKDPEEALLILSVG
jgi:hypothetical protein